MGRLSGSMSDYEVDWEVAGYDDPEEDKRKKQAEAEAQKKHLKAMMEVVAEARDLLKEAKVAAREAEVAAKEAVKAAASVNDAVGKSTETQGRSESHAKTSGALAARASDDAKASALSAAEAHKLVAEALKIAQQTEKAIKDLRAEVDNRIAKALQAVVSMPRDAPAPMVMPAPNVTNNLDGLKELVESHHKMLGAITELAQGMKAPKRVVRDRNGYVTGIEHG